MRRSKSKCEMKCDLFSIFLYTYMEHYGRMEMAVKLTNDLLFKKIFPLNFIIVGMQD